MKLRRRRKQFWWTWHHCTQLYPHYSRLYGWFDWGVARSVGGFQMPSGSVALTPLQLVALIKLGRNAALEEVIVKLPHILAMYRINGSNCTHFIESLKDNTP